MRHGIKICAKIAAARTFVCLEGGASPVLPWPSAFAIRLYFLLSGQTLYREENPSEAAISNRLEWFTLYAMALQNLAIEVTLQILCLVSPNDIAGLQLSSKRLYQIIQYHEDFICKAIAKAHHLMYKCCTSPNAQVDHGFQPLQLLCEQWRRHILIERIVAEIDERDGCIRRSLWHLWDYHEALVSDIQEQTPNNHRAFVRASSADNLVSLISVVRKCSNLLRKVSKPPAGEVQPLASDAIVKSSKSYEWYPDALAEIIITKGVGFTVEAALEKKPQAVEEFLNWTRPHRKSAFLRLCEEQRLKSKIAVLQANALISE